MAPGGDAAAGGGAMARVRPVPSLARDGDRWHGSDEGSAKGEAPLVWPGVKAEGDSLSVSRRPSRRHIPQGSRRPRPHGSGLRAQGSRLTAHALRLAAPALPRLSDKEKRPGVSSGAFALDVCVDQSPRLNGTRTVKVAFVAAPSTVRGESWPRWTMRTAAAPKPRPEGDSETTVQLAGRPLACAVH